ncbi:DUF3667 domain-containing protein [Flavobacterium sp. 3HN19-14]|uniref:DUF3667 domain-containing protein n=1 Tax=Flavobacterium sp. 3HN19-14 TaxID=3448133 RepID=UPI003EDEFA44
MDAVCKNCEAELLPEYNFCPACSQKSKLHRLSMHEVLQEAVHYFTHADKGFFQLIRDLALKNGRVAREYMDGKRKKYFPPLNFFLLSAAIYVFVATFHQHAPEALTNKDIPASILKIKDAAERSYNILVYQRKLEADWFMYKYSNIVALFVLPLTAFVFFIFYRKAKYNYTEHLVANMYLGGFTILTSAIIITPLTRLLGITEIGIAGVYYLFELVFFTAFYYNFLSKTKISQGLKAFLVSFMAISSWYVISFVGFSVYMFTGFWGIFG